MLLTDKNWQFTAMLFFFLYVMPSFILWGLQDNLLEGWKRILFLAFSPLTVKIPAKITRVYFVRIESDEYQIGIAPAFQIEYSWKNKKYSYIDHSLLNSSDEAWGPIYYHQEIVRRFGEGIPYILVIDQLKRGIKITSRVGDILDSNLINDLLSITHSEYRVANTTLQIFPFLPSTPKPIETRLSTSIPNTIAVLVVSILVALIWPIFLSFGIYRHGLSKPVLLHFVLISVCLLVVYWLPKLSNLTWLDESSRPRIPLDANFSSNSPLWN